MLPKVVLIFADNEKLSSSVNCQGNLDIKNLRKIMKQTEDIFLEGVTVHIGEASRREA